MLAAGDQARIRDWAAVHPRPRDLALKTADDPRAEAMIRFAEELARLAPGLPLRREPQDPDGLPALVVGERIRYHAVPAGPELAPFLEALGGETGAGANPAPALAKTLSRLDMPAHLRLFVAPQCPHCPAAVRSLIRLTGASTRITLSVIDGILFSETAEADGIRSTPTAVLDGGFRWAGTVRAEEIAQVLANRDPAELGSEALRGFIEEGRAPQLSAMMHERGTLFPALFELLTHDKWPVRLGAMVTMEHLAAADPDLAARGTDTIWQRLGGADDRIQGDLLYVLGEIAPADKADAVKRLARTAGHEEVREAAAEAAEKIRRRTSGKG